MMLMKEVRNKYKDEITKKLQVTILKSRSKEGSSLSSAIALIFSLASFKDSAVVSMVFVRRIVNPLREILRTTKNFR